MKKKDRSIRLAELADGRDENNLAEFPLALLSDTPPKGVRSIEFEDTLDDWATGRRLTRRVCVTASDRFGLPTAKDEDVLLALVQLTRLANNFASPEVAFNPHQVLQVLGWRNRGWAYDRVEESLHRWKGVSVHYWNAWRNNAEKAWCDTAAVGVIEYFVLRDGRRLGAGEPTERRSVFAWNRMFFESFRSGYLKKLDLAFYRGLRRPSTRRAYRFLDKRFYHAPSWEFDLREFACEKLGFSRSYNTGQLKERLTPCLRELAERGFMSPGSFSKVRPGVWTVRVRKAVAAALPTAASEPERLAAALVERGVAPDKARELAASGPDRCVSEKLAFYDWLVKKRDKRIAKNPVGFLVASIRENYTLPPDYRRTVSRGHGVSPACTSPMRDRTKQLATRGSASPPSAAPDVTERLETLSTDELKRLESLALRAASATEAASYQRLLARGSELARVLRATLIAKYAASPAAPTPEGPAAASQSPSPQDPSPTGDAEG